MANTEFWKRFPRIKNSFISETTYLWISTMSNTDVLDPATEFHHDLDVEHIRAEVNFGSPMIAKLE